MSDLIKTMLEPKSALLIAMLISLVSLKFAFVAQYFFHLEPCVLCIYQRIPFALVVLFGVIFILSKKERLLSPLLLLSAFAFLVNTGIAIFHSGVERKWWAGLESCGSNFSFGGSVEDLKAAIMNAPTARCDEIPWELFGLSMANYNVLLCLDLFCFCLLSWALAKKA